MSERRVSTNRRRPVRPPRLPSIPTFPRGPRLYDYTALPKIGGPGQPPPGFISPSTSKTEWWLYWALSKIFGVPKDPRRGPFAGYPGVWTYQKPFEMRNAPGSTIIDFVIESHARTAGVPTALRLVTEQYHLFTTAKKQAKDIIQRNRLSSTYLVKDVFEQDFINDKTGSSCIVLLKRLLAGGASPDPSRGGNPMRIRNRDQ